MIFAQQQPPFKALRAAINQTYRMDEAKCISTLLAQIKLSPASLQRIEETAINLVKHVRAQRLKQGGLDAFMMQYDLSSDEGIALMCLAESLARVPDSHTRDLLIKDKLTSADWQAHLGKSESMFVNAATWGLMLTGKILQPEQQRSSKFVGALKRWVGRSSEPVIRKTVSEAMEILGRQFVLGGTIEDALQRSVAELKKGYRFSYDMLGEAARTMEDADAYFEAYKDAITAIGATAQQQEKDECPGISVKLSALHPRFEFSQRRMVVPVLVERLLQLATMAKKCGIDLTVDAEEADRLDITLDIIEQVFKDPALQQWEGFGLAIQAYQKRCFVLIDWLANLAREEKRRIKVRLVKGAYWDSEIKMAQELGLDGYPVFTRKVNTDVSYLACAKKIIAEEDAFYPQFATHNAHTVAAIMEFMGERRDFEFQCLQGMGHALYDQIVDSTKNYQLPCRIYAPVGAYKDLLPYLVRRLLENGANTSFVNRIVDETMPVTEIIADPIAKANECESASHPHIPLPRDLYLPQRRNSRGFDLTNLNELTALASQMSAAAKRVKWQARPSVGSGSELSNLLNPSDRRRVVGNVSNATMNNVDQALSIAEQAQAGWNALSTAERADCLLRAAELLEINHAELMALLCREAGKVIPDALSEVREAVDFCRYYAAMAKEHMSPVNLPGPTGESNQLQCHGRGVVVCISPWNFPLAIFTGQVVAALVTGNAVIAKPAEQTSLIAARAIEIFHEAGIPEEVLQLVPGPGEEIGAGLVADPRTKGVIFTGSTATARHINQALSLREGPIIPLIAETGGQNAMIADSTALPEQLVMDVIESAFHSAGQRCSACRVLFVQEDIADTVITMLKGAMALLRLGDPCLLATDIGPVIDDVACFELKKHLEFLHNNGELIYQVPLDVSLEYGSYFAPCAFEIKQLSLLTQEVFGPILHVIRYAAQDLDKVIADINATGYGLTLGVQTRITEVADYIQQRVHAGNCYVNRSMIGAVVGVQPFGGEGLSGTGPKAGGPHYLSRLCSERTYTINTTAAGGNASLMTLAES